MAKKENTHEYANISICLLGCSNSGKTTFYSGIEQALINGAVKFGNGCYIHLNFCSVNRGIAVDKNNQIEETLTEQRINPQDQLKNIRNSAMANTGSAFAAVANAASTSEQAESSQSSSTDAVKKDDRQVDNINISSGLAGVLKLNAELDKQLGLKNGFHAPTATVRYLVLSFEVKINQKTKCILHITDYAGELIQLMEKVPDSMLNMLTTHLGRSEAAIVLANARDMSKVITNPTTKNPSMFLVDTAKKTLYADRINNLICNIDAEAFTFLLALTQTDSPQVDPRIKQNNYKTVANNLTEYIYSLAFLRVQDEEMWSTGIIPVSAIGTKRDGSPNVNDKNELLDDAELNQEGVDKAVLYCLYNAVLQKINKISDEIKDLGFIPTSRDKLQRRSILKQQIADLIEVKSLFDDNLHYFDDVCEKKIALQKVSHLVK